MFVSALVRRCRSVAALLALSVAVAAHAAGPEVLNQVPSDAYGVIVVGNVRAFSNKVSNVVTQLQIPLPTNDVLGMMTRSVGITAGFDANGSAALVLLKPPPGSDRTGTKYFDGIPPAVALVPTTNASLMLQRFSPTDPDKDGISQITLPDNPDEKPFSAVVDQKWVAVSLTKEALQAYLARTTSFAGTASPETLKVFDANDLVVWGNVEKLGQGVDQWLDDQETNIVGMRDLTNYVQGGDVFAATMQKHVARLGFDLCRDFFKDAGASMLTVRLTDSGATLGIIADFKPDSPMGKFVTAQSSSGGVSLQGLPPGDFLIACAVKWNGASVAAPVRDFLAQIIADPALEGDKRVADLKKSMDLMSQTVPLTSGLSFSLLQIPGIGKDGLLSGAFLVESSDPKKLLELQLQSADHMLTNENMNPDIKTSVTVSPDALTVKDVPLAKIQIKMALRDETPDKPIPPASRAEFEASQKLYGPDGLTMYVGVVGKRMVMIYGTQLPMMESAIAAAQSNTDVLDSQPEIASTKNDLVANPIAVMYMPLARWVLLGQTVDSGREPPPAAVAAASGAPPMVMSLGVTGHMITSELHIPMATIRATQKTVQRMEEGTLGPPDRVLPNLP